MPVHTRRAGEILHVVLDGDFTSEEVRRVGKEALDRLAPDDPAPILLDYSGAAGLGRKHPDDVKETAAFFGTQAAHVHRVAILAPSVGHELLSRAAEAARSAGLEISVFRKLSEAEDWLAE